MNSGHGYIMSFLLCFCFCALPFYPRRAIKGVVDEKEQMFRQVNRLANRTDKERNSWPRQYPY